METTGVIGVIKALGDIITPLILAYIALLQLKTRKKQDEIHRQINGMQEKYILAEKNVSYLEGKEEVNTEIKKESVAKEVTRRDESGKAD